MTPWEQHQAQLGSRAARLRLVQDARRVLDVQRLQLVFDGVTQIRTFTRFAKDGSMQVRRTIVMPTPINFVVIKLETPL